MEGSGEMGGGDADIARIGLIGTSVSLLPNSGRSKPVGGGDVKLLSRM